MALTISSKVRLSKILIHLGAFIPLCLNYYWSITDQNGADPVKAIIHFTGIGALHCLLICLSISPIAKKFKLPWLMQTRRLIGLYAFAYAGFHVLNFWWFELGFSWSIFTQEIIERPYIWLGMSGFIILTVLALTSPNKVRRILGRRWQQIHNWIYPATILIWIHFYWSRKADISEPFIYLAIILVLLYLRKDKLISKWFSKK